METVPSARATLRPLLVLGRISNLPTVWTNCLAAWLLCRGNASSRFILLCLGATLLYTAGMFLNDAFDESFDRQYRQERPIPAGHVNSRIVWFLGVVLLTLGWLSLGLLGPRCGVWGAVLIVAIIVYDALHKKTPAAPLLMCLCRFLLYVVAAAAARAPLSAELLWRGLALAAYVAGISYLAKGESRHGSAPAWSLGLLFVPAAVALLRKPEVLPITAVSLMWLGWCLRGSWLSPKRPLSSGVSGLLAGITLVDLQGSMSYGSSSLLVFGGLFLTALLLQQIAPAT